MPCLRLQQLHYHHNGPLNLELASGECVSLSGASGSGKSLLLRAIADLDAYQGDIWLDEFHSQQMPAHQWRQKVGLLPAETHWWEEQVGAHFPHWPTSIAQQLGFPPDTADWPVMRLSSGERQRLGLARMLACKPQALLLDEPTANLDPHNTAIIEHLIQDYSQQQQAPVLWVSHDSAQRQRIAQRHVHLKEGQLQDLVL